MKHHFPLLLLQVLLTSNLVSHTAGNTTTSNNSGNEEEVPAVSNENKNNQAQTQIHLKEYLQTEVHPLWLRERCQEEFYADPDTLQPRYNLHEEVEDLKVLQVITEEEKESNAGVWVLFSDDKRCFYRTEMLQAELGFQDSNSNNNNGQPYLLQATDWYFPPLNKWDKNLLAPPSFEHDDIIAESDETRKFLSNLISTGIALVTNVPRVEGECARFGSRFSSLRETEWGKNFNVRTRADDAAVAGTKKRDLAYTKHGIGMHIDNAYRVDTPPAYQLLHAIEHCSGPNECHVYNQFVDGFAVAEALCQKHPEYFQILSQTVLRWENNGGDGGSVLVRYAPMLEVEDNANSAKTTTACPPVKAINFSAKSGGYAPALPTKAAMELFYRAKRTFSQMLHDDETFAIRVQLFPGALVMFDNRRILHARSEIAESDGDRWLQGCYVNRDGILFRYERLRRKFQTLTASGFRTLKEATKNDFDRMGREYDVHVVQKTRDHLLDLLVSQKSQDAYLGAGVSLYEHNVQTATRALRRGVGQNDDDDDDEMVVVSLFHDVFETLAVKNHGELISAMLAPWISPQAQWMLAHHEIFQGYYYFDYYPGNDKNRRDMFLDHPFYNITVDWCEELDQASFDPDYPSLPLSYFIPIIDRILSKPPYWWNPNHPKAGAVVSAEEVAMKECNNDDGNEDQEAAPEAARQSTTWKGSSCSDTWTCYGS